MNTKRSKTISGNKIFHLQLKKKKETKKHFTFFCSKPIICFIKECAQKIIKILNKIHNKILQPRLLKYFVKPVLKMAYLKTRE